MGVSGYGKSLCRSLAKNGCNISMFNRYVDDVDIQVDKNF